MKIALITPFPPYRGGISKHSENLYRELSLKKEVKVYNFSRQYPDILFPGKNQYTKSNNYSDMVRMIDSINPMSWRKTANDIIKNNFNKVIFRYWNPFFIPCYISIIKRLKKENKDISIYSICDNVIPHENLIFQKPLLKLFFEKLDGIIIMSDSTENELISLNKFYNYKKLFLPIISDLGKTLDYKRTRIALDLDEDKIIFLFFGLIREYKGLDILLKSINKISQNLSEKFELLIVGENYEHLDKYQNILNDNFISNVKWITEYIPDDLISSYFSCCDYVVLPYKTASQSGIIPMAYYYNKPVITSDLLGLKEMVIDGQTGHIFNNCDIDSLTKILQNCIKGRNNVDYSQIDEFKNKISTKKYVKQLLLFINE